MPGEEFFVGRTASDLAGKRVERSGEEPVDGDEGVRGDQVELVRHPTVKLFPAGFALEWRHGEGGVERSRVGDGALVVEQHALGILL